MKFWATGNDKETRVEYISSKNNQLADDLSRGRIEECLKIANKIKSFKQIRKAMTKEDKEIWDDVVKKITENSDSQITLRSRRKRG